MKRKVFKSKTFNNEFYKSGYIVFDHNQTSISERLSQLYTKYSHENVNKGFNTTHFSHNSNYKREVLQLAKDIFKESFSEQLIEYEVFFANLMIKTPNNKDLLPVHADWVYVDEDKYSAISIWIPADDITDQNGPFGIIPNSCQLYEPIRGPEIVSSFRKFDKVLKDEKGVLLPITRKQAVLYDLRLLHYSLPNRTSTPRIAINITLKHRNSEIIHYSKQGNKIHKFNHLNEEFFHNYHAHQIPKDKVPSEVIPITPQISDKEIIEHFQLSVSSKSPSLWEKITHIFKL